MVALGLVTTEHLEGESRRNQLLNKVRTVKLKLFSL